jgi:hypothetical protein
MKALARVAVGVVALIGSSEVSALAFPSGIFGVARPEAGCTCHGIPELRNTTTQLAIDGLPQSYTPGASYELTIWVMGVPIPTGPPTGSALRGFNLETTAGKLTAHAADRTVQAENLSECDVRRSVAACGIPNKPPCGVNGPQLCRTFAECDERRCTTPGTGSCRLCSQLLVDIEATHTRIDDPLGDPAGTYAGDGNSVIDWMLTWTAPSAGTGPVTFYLAGNIVNSNGGNDAGDVWSVLDPGIVVPEAP